MKLFFSIIFLILLSNCSKPKTVLICGDHVCVNKSEAEQYFEKNLSIDPSFAGDFNIKDRLVSKDSENKLIFTGLHITKRSYLKSDSKVFSMNKVWSALIKDKNLCGLESEQKFYHLNTFEMYNKISSLKIID